MTKTYGEGAAEVRARELRRALGRVSVKIRDLLLERRSSLEETRKDPRLSENYRGQRLQEQDQDYAAKLVGIRAEAQTSHNELVEIAQIPAKDESTVEEQLLAEITGQRLWSRYVRLLDAEGQEAPPMELVQRLADEQDAAGLKVMREELPSYLESRGWDPQHVRAIEGQISQAELPLLPPEEQEARSVQQEAEAGWQRLEIAFAHAEKDLEGSLVETTTLPVWEGGMIPVASPAPAGAYATTDA